MKHIALLIAIICFAKFISAQVPLNTNIQILKAEDARRYDAALETLMKSPNALVRNRAALAAGRIGDDRAIPALAALLEKDTGLITAETAAFAIGEIESIKGADAILKVLAANRKTERTVTSLALEAAGKIAAANPKEPKAKELGMAIVEVLKGEAAKPSETPQVVLRGLTAVLRARPGGAEETVRKFLNIHEIYVATALNTLIRLRAKSANGETRDLLGRIVAADPDVRANAARLFAASEDREAGEILVNMALSDWDPRVRVSAIRALGALKDAKAADKLFDHAETLFKGYKSSKFANPIETSELIETVASLGRILENTNDERIYQRLAGFAKMDALRSPEFYIALARIGPRRQKDNGEKPDPKTWRQIATMAQFLGEFSSIEPTADEPRKLKADAPELLRKLATSFIKITNAEGPEFVKAAPDVLRSFARYKTSDLNDVLREALENEDVFIRAAAAELLAERAKSKENVDALQTAFWRALMSDKHENDAQLAILDAVYKLDKKASVAMLRPLLDERDYLLRRKAFEMLADEDLQKDFPDIVRLLAAARVEGKDQVRPFFPKFGTRLGQILNTDADYRRAVLRKNGSVKAVLTTEKGTFTIDFFPEDAPLTVDNFIKLARSGYFNGLEVHRVVPNFVMQDGDPRGDGNGGPGWSIRCEINMRPYERGAVGMALSGKDTGGSQWFVTHSPQPHLDGGYTVFGRVNETGMKVVDNIVRGDRILTVKIVGR
jgi:cyclophilin family peptidyl-prolyl cis-trans isomerase/HEAT repeat protein